MFKKYVVAIALAGLVVGPFTAVRAQVELNTNTNSNTNTNINLNTNSNSNANSNSNTNANVNSNTNVNRPKPSVDSTCMQAAIDKRDTAIIVVWDAYHASIKTALEARRTALKNAWGLTDRAARNRAIKDAWKAYRDMHRKARKAFGDARRKAWQQFSTDRRACKVSINTDDTLGLQADNTL